MNPVVDAKNKLFTKQRASPYYIFPREKYKTPAGSSEGEGEQPGTNPRPRTQTPEATKKARQEAGRTVNLAR